MAKRSRSEVLADFDSLPDSALVDDTIAANYLDTSRSTLAVWRHQRRGPDFVRIHGHVVRYQVQTLRKIVEDGAVKCGPVFDQEDARWKRAAVLAAAGENGAQPSART
jgi:hypothetical protein